MEPWTRGTVRNAKLERAALFTNTHGSGVRLAADPTEKTRAAEAFGETKVYLAIIPLLLTRLGRP